MINYNSIPENKINLNYKMFIYEYNKRSIHIICFHIMEEKNQENNFCNHTWSDYEKQCENRDIIPKCPFQHNPLKWIYVGGSLSRCEKCDEEFNTNALYCMVCRAKESGLIGKNDVDVPKIVYLEGCMGAGKSSLIEKMKRMSGLNANYIPETDFSKFNQWNMLEKLYENPQIYGFTFQVYVMAIQLEEIKRSIEEHPNVDVHIIERSPSSVFHCFGKKILKDKKLELNVLSLLHDVTYKIIPRPIGMIYIDISPEKSLDRIKCRGLPEEKIITLDYLKDLEKYQNNWFENNFPPYNPIQAIRIPFISGGLQKMCDQAIYFIEKFILEKEGNKKKKTYIAELYNL